MKLCTNCKHYVAMNDYGTNLCANPVNKEALRSPVTGDVTWLRCDEMRSDAGKNNGVEYCYRSADLFEYANKNVAGIHIK